MKGKLLGFAVALLATATIGIVQLQANAVDTTRDCDKYAIVYCGTMSEQEARNKYNNGDNAAVFRNFGITKSEIRGMQEGTVYRDGTVRVGGRVVATGAVTAIRHFSGGNIPGSSTAKRVSVSRMADAQTALVKFDQNGKFLFAIMKPCGNPVTGNPTPPPAKPSAVCKSLTVTPLAGNTQFRFDAQATAKHGAKIKSYTFQIFKDGKLINSKRTTTPTYTYTQSQPGAYTARVVVKSSIGELPVTENCTKPFTVPEKPAPEKPGIKIEKLVEGVKYKRVNVDVEYSYQIAVTNTGNKDLTNAVVTDTPEQGVTLVSAAQGSIANNKWTHTIPSLKVGETMNFTLKAKVPEFLAGRITNTVCVDTPDVPGTPDDCDTADVDVPEEEKVVVCNPKTGETITVDKEDQDKYAPIGSSKCKEETPTPETPKAEVLPTTGPEEAFAQLFGAASLASAGAYYLTSRRQ